MGIVVAALILQGPASTGIAAPLVAALLLATAVLVFGARLGRGRAILASVLVVAGGVASLLVASSGAQYAFRGAAEWPGVVLYAYVLALLVYVPLRVRAARPREDEAAEPAAA
jgi:Kef-type K+ transport system membrane component KefB